MNVLLVLLMCLPLQPPVVPAGPCDEIRALIVSAQMAVNTAWVAQFVAWSNHEADVVLKANAFKLLQDALLTGEAALIDMRFWHYKLFFDREAASAAELAKRTAELARLEKVLAEYRAKASGMGC